MTSRPPLPKAPSDLSPEARQHFTRIVTEYVLDDAAGLILLATALRSFDQMRAAQKKIQKSGLTIKDRFGQPKANPLLAIETRARSAMLTAFKALRINEPPGAAQ